MTALGWGLSVAAFGAFVGLGLAGRPWAMGAAWRRLLAMFAALGVLVGGNSLASGHGARTAVDAGLVAAALPALLVAAVQTGYWILSPQGFKFGRAWGDAHLKAGRRLSGLYTTSSQRRVVREFRRRWEAEDPAQTPEAFIQRAWPEIVAAEDQISKISPSSRRNLG